MHFIKALEPFIQPSVIFDSAATESAREMAEKSILPVSIALKRGQIVAREGDTITPNILAQISAIRSYTSSSRQFNRFIGFLFLITALYWIAWKFIEHRGAVIAFALAGKNFYAVWFCGVVQTFLFSVCFRTG